MKCTFNKADLLDMVVNVSAVIEKDAIMPALKCVLIDCNENNTLTFTATNTDVWISDRSQSIVNEAGRILVPGSLFKDIINNMPNGYVTMETIGEDDSWLSIHNEGAMYVTRYVLYTLPADDFPDWPETPATAHVIQLPAMSARQMSAFITGCEDAEHTNEALRGVSLRSVPDGFRLQSTNGSALHVAHYGIDTSVFGQVDVILPGNAISELSKFTRDGRNDVSVSVIRRTEDPESQISYIQFSVDTQVILASVLDGAFPVTELIENAPRTYQVRINGSDVAKSVRRVSFLADKNIGAINMRFVNGKIIMQSSTTELGESQDEIPYEGTVDDDVRISVNCGYLLRAVARMSDKELELHFSDSTEIPIMLRPVNIHDYVTTTAYIMPVLM